MYLVAENILTERAADDGLHGMLGHDMHLDPVCILTVIITVRALVKLKPKSI